GRGPEFIGGLLVSLHEPVPRTSTESTRRVLGQLLVWRQTRNLQDRPNLDGSLACRRNPSRDTDCFVEIPCVDDVEPAELLAGLGERTVRDQRFTLADPNACRR